MKAANTAQSLIVLGVVMLVPAFIMGLFYYFKIKDWRAQRERSQQSDEEAKLEETSDTSTVRGRVAEIQGTPVCELDPGVVQEVDGKEICEVDGSMKIELEAREREEIGEVGDRMGRYMAIVG